jgi:hypothetical protein
MGRAHPLPRRRPHRDRFQYRRTRHAPGGDDWVILRPFIKCL